MITKPPLNFDHITRHITRHISDDIDNSIFRGMVRDMNNTTPSIPFRDTIDDESVLSDTIVEELTKRHVEKGNSNSLEFRVDELERMVQELQDTITDKNDYITSLEERDKKLHMLENILKGAELL